jgi:tetratricopeptide (TPR) repeat protein
MDVAQELETLGRALAAAGDPDEALAATHEAVTLQRWISMQFEGSCHDQLARALGGQSKALLASGQATDGVAVLEQAIELLWPYFESDPGGYHEWMAELLTDRMRLAEQVAISPAVQARISVLLDEPTFLGDS